MPSHFGMASELSGHLSLTMNTDTTFTIDKTPLIFFLKFTFINENLVYNLRIRPHKLD